MTAPAKRARKPKPRASGPTQSKAARRSAGRVRVEVWLPADVAGKLDDLARDAGSRAEAIVAAINTEWALSETFDGPRSGHALALSQNRVTQKERHGR